MLLKVLLVGVMQTHRSINGKDAIDPVIAGLDARVISAFTRVFDALSPRMTAEGPSQPNRETFWGPIAAAQAFCPRCRSIAACTAAFDATPAVSYLDLASA